MKKLGIGFVGLGGRGRGLLNMVLDMEDIEIKAVCDRIPDRLNSGLEACKQKYGRDVDGTHDHRELAARSDIEAVIIPTSWNDHIKVAVDVMNAGKYAAFEVGPASSLDECWQLIRTHERTGIHCGILENCCYGREELTVLNMIKKGIFGELIHAQGGYEHDLRYHLIDVEHERTWHNVNRNGDIYPTHGLGPIQTYLNINRGNRMLTLTAMASKSRGLHTNIRDHIGSGHPLAVTDFTMGDIITTTIRCAHGETILLTHDTSLPRPYSRAGRVQGTKGLWMEDNASIYIEGRSPEHQWEKMESYMEEFEHPLWKQFRRNVRGGHGGMDYLVMRGFFEAVRNKTAPPIDVYDTATMMAVSCLSEQSISLGSMPVAVPDFTDGKWIKRESAPVSIFSLDSVHDELFNDGIEI